MLEHGSDEFFELLLAVRIGAQFVHDLHHSHTEILYTLESGQASHNFEAYLATDFERLV